MKLRETLKRIPLLAGIYRSARSKYSIYRLNRKSTEEVFADIHRKNSWGGIESISGPGSDTDQTRQIVEHLPAILRNYDISTMLDLPCGDFNWMKQVDLSNIEYCGADILSDLVNKNAKQYARENIRFEKLDLLRDKLPPVDLILCRDCLIHLSYDDMFQALDNICASGSEYLLTTTFPGSTENRDIATGQGRNINLEAYPFNLPSPLETINEKCTLGNGIYRDKSLGLWRISDIRERLNNA
jgi:hypothetical protein